MKSKLKVVNKYYHKNNDENSIDIYIGRGSVLGNPYTHLDLKLTKAKFRVQTRQEAIENYESYIRKQIEQGNKEIIDELNRIIELMKIKNKVFLVCFCKPASCHGDIIKKVLKEKIKNNEKF